MKFLLDVNLLCITAVIFVFNPWPVATEDEHCHIHSRAVQTTEEECSNSIYEKDRIGVIYHWSGQCLSSNGSTEIRFNGLLHSYVPFGMLKLDDCSRADDLLLRQDGTIIHMKSGFFVLALGQDTDPKDGYPILITTAHKELELSKFSISGIGYSIIEHLPSGKCLYPLEDENLGEKIADHNKGVLVFDSLCNTTRHKFKLKAYSEDDQRYQDLMTYYPTDS